MSQDKFEWTDERVKEFAAKLLHDRVSWAAIHDCSAAPIPIHIAFEKFKEEKTKRDWEVVAFRYKSNGHIQTVERSGDVYANNAYSHCVNDDGYEIYSVKRLSDSVVFSIGDEVEWGYCRVAHKIESIFEECGWLKLEGVIPCKFSFVLQGLLQKVVKPKPLFVTEDGKEIFDKDNWWSVWTENGRRWRKRDKCFSDGFVGDSHNPDAKVKRFSTEQAADEYILLNKPCLSVNDVKNGLMIREGCGLEMTLVALAKEKLSK
jgi:hypothetical protein